jgi:tRNA (guanine37-N1)-methyltransferase
LEVHVLTAFPRIFQGPLDESIIKRAEKRQLVSFFLHDFRDYATDKHKKIDDYPYGGGPGMILKPEPIFRCVEDVRKKHDMKDTPLILLAPEGELFSQKKAVQLSLHDKLFFLCGHYKGIDERVVEELIDAKISVGDYILTGGELAALVIIDAVVRLLPGAISDIDSAETDSFQTGLLDHPHYTRPEVYNNISVPKVLLSGNHADIAEWRRNQTLEKTRALRNDLYEKFLKEE